MGLAYAPVLEVQAVRQPRQWPAGRQAHLAVRAVGVEDNVSDHPVGDLSGGQRDDRRTPRLPGLPRITLDPLGAVGGRAHQVIKGALKWHAELRVRRQRAKSVGDGDEDWAPRPIVLPMPHDESRVPPSVGVEQQSVAGCRFSLTRVASPAQKAADQPSEVVVVNDQHYGRAATNGTPVMVQSEEPGRASVSHGRY